MDRILLLFDIDGTLMKSGGAGMEAMYRVADELFGQGFSWDGVEAAGNLDPLIYAQMAAQNNLPDSPAHHQRFHDVYIEKLAQSFHPQNPQIEIMPGIHKVLAMLREREQTQGDIVLGLLTGNYTQAVPIKLGAIGVDHTWFGLTAFGDEAATRAELVSLAMRKYEAMLGHAAHAHGVIVIGDTPRDVACAKAHDARILAVATGGCSVESLLACGADRAVEDLADPTPLLDMIAQARQDVDASSR